MIHSTYYFVNLINNYIMNVLILTPDRVGSTLLQRYITVIMNNHTYDKPVVNLHELSNGLEVYWNDKFSRNMVRKPDTTDEGSGKKNWGYYQKLSEITDILSKTDHYKTSRLALYHLNSRNDDIKEQLNFYSYLNSNFYLISAKRKNLLEHGLSWCIYTHSKHLNVFSHRDKVKTFDHIIKSGGIHIDIDVFRRYINNYLKYEEWVDRHFDVNNYFYYERDMPNLEEYVSKLNIYPKNTTPKTFNDSFGMEWNTWNSCHYLLSDMSGMSNQVSNILELPNESKLFLTNKKQKYEKFETDYKTNSLLDIERRSKRTDLSLNDREHLRKNLPVYKSIHNDINDMRENGLLVSNIPIKLQTMMEKASMIKNYKEVFDWYNRWCIRENQEDRMIGFDQLKDNTLAELRMWYNQ